jgi:hypothetical protein
MAQWLWLDDTTPVHVRAIGAAQVLDNKNIKVCLPKDGGMVARHLRIGEDERVSGATADRDWLLCQRKHLARMLDDQRWAKGFVIAHSGFLSGQEGLQ